VRPARQADNLTVTTRIALLYFLFQEYTGRLDLKTTANSMCNISALRSLNTIQYACIKLFTPADFYPLVWKMTTNCSVDTVKHGACCFCSIRFSYAYHLYHTSEVACQSHAYVYCKEVIVLTKWLTGLGFECIL
jgi:hypothetical protein